MTRCILIVLIAALAWAQEPADPSVAEQQSLMKAANDASTSPLDAIRAFEAHLKRYPESTQRPDIELALARAALESGDWDRLIQYGEPLLKDSKEDTILLDRVSFALITKNDKAMADRAYKYARTLENLMDRIKVPEGRDAPRVQDDRDRTLSRALLYQSRARKITGEPDEAVRLAARAFNTAPSEEAAREWAESLYAAGKKEDAIKRLADAFAISDGRTTDAARMADRILLGEWYAARYGNEKGLGDLILSAYDRMSELTQTRMKKLLALDPNSSAQSPLDYTVTKLDGKPFRLSTLKGKIVVMDFWATWCAPCKVQHPLYETLKQKYPQVTFLAISADEQHEVVAPFLDEEKWDKNVYFEDGLVHMLSVRNIPATMIFDRTGRLVSRLDGFDPEFFVDQMSTRLDSLLAQPATAAK
jgi:thiol-disulfide isomerase/thioredoxin